MKSKSHLIIGTLSAVELSLAMGLSLTPITVSVAAFLSVAPDIDEANSNVLNMLISKKATKRIHSFLIYSLLIFCFYLYMKTSSNIYIGIIISFLFITIIEKKVTANKVRSLVLSGLIGLIALIMLFYKVNIGVVVLTFLIASFPIMSHRSFTHSLLIILLIYLLLSYIERTLNVNDLAIIGTFAYSTHLMCDIITKRGIPLFYPFSKKYFSLGNLRVGYFMCNFVEILVIFLLFLAILFHFA
ncbi:MAG: metal-dependent hydrolase [Peptostreptococcus sp.]|uniref:metal-dependent hydrolase n=1 Tax=Peptostreptococcus sp. TaxID=1262 RepID=UPI002FCA6A45